MKGGGGGGGAAWGRLCDYNRMSVLIEFRVVASASLILMDILKERGLYKDLTQLCIRMTAEVGVHLSFLPPSGSLSFPSFPPPTSFLPS